MDYIELFLAHFDLDEVVLVFLKQRRVLLL